MTYTDKGAVISKDGRFRYRLWRVWSGVDLFAPQTAIFIMLNPSTADGLEDDPTIRRCVSFARSWGCERLEVVNLFAYRATDPNELAEQYDDAVGSENDDTIARLIADNPTALIVCAWGEGGLALGRGDAVRYALNRQGRKPMALLINRSGMAGHPLYLPANSSLVSYESVP